MLWEARLSIWPATMGEVVAPQFNSAEPGSDQEHAYKLLKPEKLHLVIDNPLTTIGSNNE